MSCVFVCAARKWTWLEFQILHPLFRSIILAQTSAAHHDQPNPLPWEPPEVTTVHSQQFRSPPSRLLSSARIGKTEYPRENLPTSGIIRHDFHVRKSGSDPVGNRTPVRLGGGRWLHVELYERPLVNSPCLAPEVPPSPRCGLRNYSSDVNAETMVIPPPARGFISDVGTAAFPPSNFVQDKYPPSHQPLPSTEHESVKGGGGRSSLDRLLSQAPGDTGHSPPPLISLSLSLAGTTAPPTLTARAAASDELLRSQPHQFRTLEAAAPTLHSLTCCGCVGLTIIAPYNADIEQHGVPDVMNPSRDQLCRPPCTTASGLNARWDKPSNVIRSCVITSGARGCEGTEKGGGRVEWWKASLMWLFSPSGNCGRSRVVGNLRTEWDVFFENEKRGQRSERCCAGKPRRKCDIWCLRWAAFLATGVLAAVDGVFMLVNVAISHDRRTNKVLRPVAMLILHKAKEYTTCIQVDRKQGFQKYSFYREQPIAECKERLSGRLPLRSGQVRSEVKTGQLKHTMLIRNEGDKDDISTRIKCPIVAKLKTPNWCAGLWSYQARWHDRKTRRREGGQGSFCRTCVQSVPIAVVTEVVHGSLPAIRQTGNTIGCMRDSSMCAISRRNAVTLPKIPEVQFLRARFVAGPDAKPLKNGHERGVPIREETQPSATRIKGRQHCSLLVCALPLSDVARIGIISPRALAHVGHVSLGVSDPLPVFPARSAPSEFPAPEIYFPATPTESFRRLDGNLSPGQFLRRVHIDNTCQDSHYLESVRRVAMFFRSEVTSDTWERSIFVCGPLGERSFGDPSLLTFHRLAAGRKSCTISVFICLREQCVPGRTSPLVVKAIARGEVSQRGSCCRRGRSRVYCKGGHEYRRPHNAGRGSEVEGGGGGAVRGNEYRYDAGASKLESRRPG
ncbi:hypothetical protein PR048_014820 [Dryococelus australis]|uniref:Uncharacterized protein n=1 Tax=Dryococelus australis TaxID=614101 RepID=A0ABQ9HFN8_9NEOP|nr:hypothetical protein PR048_014820 [Dryococelus australis]